MNALPWVTVNRGQSWGLNPSSLVPECVLLTTTVVGEGSVGSCLQKMEHTPTPESVVMVILLFMY